MYESQETVVVLMSYSAPFVFPTQDQGALFYCVNLQDGKR